MKKVGIITIIDYQNYGNRLQNYATQEVIKSLNLSATTIVNEPFTKRNRRIKRITNSIININFDYLRKAALKLINSNKNKDPNTYKEQRKRNFIDFTRKYIKESDYTITPNNLPKNLDDDFDFFVVGSDQVWNPNFRYGSPIDFLTFTSKRKKIAYAASFGVSSIDSKYATLYSKWLSDFNHISVREVSGAKLVKRLTNRDAQVLIDPTMMLSKEEWMKISEPINVSNKFILTYFLGDTSREVRLWIELLAKKYSLEVINLADPNDIEHYCTGPSKFISYINQCSLFLTNSFHGVVFSILFGKPFVVFERNSKLQSMSSRIDTILAKFELENRKWCKETDSQQYFTIDYANVENILERERLHTSDFLKNALNLSDDNIK